MPVGLLLVSKHFRGCKFVVDSRLNENRHIGFLTKSMKHSHSVERGRIKQHNATARFSCPLYLISVTFHLLTSLGYRDVSLN